MNSDFLILRNIYENKEISQRKIATSFDISLGKVNQVMKGLEKKGYIYLEKKYKVTKEGIDYLNSYKTNTAIILANENIMKDKNGTYVPIGLKKLGGVSLLEKQIIDLQKSGINNIYLVAGNIIEAYEYLLTKYNINFIYDDDYEEKGTSAKLLKVRSICEENDCYVLSSNIWSKDNLYHSYEIESFIYGCYKKNLKDSIKLIYNVKNILLGIEDGGENDYAKTKILFLKKEYSKKLLKLIKAYDNLPSAKRLDYDDILLRNLDILDDMYVYKIREELYDEIKTKKDLLKYDDEEKINFPMTFVLRSFSINEKKVINVKTQENQFFDKIFSFSIEKKNYVNRSFFVREYDKVNIIYRNIEKEKKLYEDLKKDDRFEKILYIDNDFKTISEDFDGKRDINLFEENERKMALHFLRKMHNDNISINNTLDINQLIDEYIKYLNDYHINVLYQDFKESTYMVKKLIYFILSSSRPQVVCKCFLEKNDICFSANGLKIQNVNTIALFDPLIDISSLTTILNYSPEEMKKIYEEYQNMVDVDNIAMTNIDDTKAMHIVVSFMGILYFIQAIKIYLRESIYNVSYRDEGLKKYHLYKICAEYMKKII